VSIPILTVVVLAYLGLLTILAYYGWKQTTSAEDYLVAGRNIHPAVMSLSYGATFISTSAIVGFGGVAGLFGFSLLWLTFLNISLGILVAFAVFGVRIRRISLNLGTQTFPSLLGERYRSKFLTVFSALMIFIFMPAYTSIILVGGARFVEEALKIDYNLAVFILAIIVGGYVLSGGLKAVMYTDAFCAGLMFIGMVVLLFSAYRVAGGVIAGHQALTAMKHMVPEGLAAAGHRGWTAMPALGSPLWWTVVTTIIMGVGIGVLAQPQLAMRFMTVSSNKSLYRAIAVGGVFIFFMTGTAFLVGPLTNLYFYNTRGLISVAAMPGGNIDLIIPTFISEIMPTWFLYLFLIALLSAAISTLSSLIHVQGTSLGKDILETLGVRQQDSTLMTRGGVLVAVLLAVILAYILPGSIIARATAFWFGICASGFLPVLVGALYWPRGTREGAVASVVAGFGVSILGFVFLHAAESVPFGISRFLFGVDYLLPYPWTHVDPLIYALPVAAILYVAVSLATRPLEEKHLAKVFAGLPENGRKDKRNIAPAN
jgi:solute:Na+ symporter, SSS family